ncbi:hypothetical protein [Haloarcula sp. JP-L23]|uniref:hypothetical protein n=1 Tax=Haloarcula sp. JP-L23 TaxID=2716717 RepID=UPI00140EEECB|nr:hypothetical protein G9465_25150 [Haloarcula sp. JP-L23]
MFNALGDFTVGAFQQDSMTIVLSGTIIGGLIAGSAGLAGTYYSLERRRIVEHRNWLSQLKHLTSRVTFDLNGPPEEAADGTTDKQRTAKRIVESTVPRIEDHLATAPVEISEDIREMQDQLVVLHRNIDINRPPKAALVSDLREADSVTNDIYECAEKSAPVSWYEKLP